MDEQYDTIERRAFDDLVALLRRDIANIQRLPSVERQVAQMAVEGRDIHEIAQRVGISEDAVWRIIATVAGEEPEAVVDEPVRTFESSGLGADTDPGVTGGYGDTDFGSIGNEPDIPVTEAPEGEAERPRTPKKKREDPDSEPRAGGEQGGG